MCCLILSYPVQGQDIAWQALFQAYLPVIREAQANTRLPRWLDARDTAFARIDGPPGIDRDPAERWIWLCLTDRQTGLRWTAAAPFASVQTLFSGKPYPFTPTIGLHPKDHRKCWT
jgi:hypothetical protein